MLKNKKMLFDFKEEIKLKYGYGEELAETIAMTAESLIDEMGKEYESVILDAIRSCKYVVANKFKNAEDGTRVEVSETIYDVLLRENMLEIFDGAMLSAGDLRRAKGVYTSIPRISYKDKRFNLESVDRIIVLPSYFDHNSPASLGTITQETMHLVKSFINEYTINGSTLIARSGIAISEYDLNFEENKGVNRTFKSEMGIALEKGLNSYDELKVVRGNYDSNYEVYGYTYQRIVGGFLSDNLGLDSLIKEAQLTGNMQPLTKVFDSNLDIGFEGFMHAMDETAKLEYERNEHILDAIKSKELLKKLDKYFSDEIVPRVRSLKCALNPEFSENKRISN